MGVSVNDLKMFIKLASEGALTKNSSVAEIGAQQLSESVTNCKSLIIEIGEKLGAIGPIPCSIKNQDSSASSFQHLDKNAPMASLFWKWLGIEYLAIDVDGSVGALPLDLNFDHIPKEFINKFDLVTNLGTTEHIANQVNALKAIHDLTKVGWFILHNLPAQGYLHHGLINYNTKFFWMLARTTGYRW